MTPTNVLPPADLVAAICAQANRADPYPLYAQLRATGPVALPDRPVLLVSSFADCQAVLRSTAVSAGRSERTSGGGRAGLLAAIGEIPGSMRGLPLTMLDPPEHTRQRGRVSAAFTPRVVDLLAPVVGELVDDLIDAFTDVVAAGRPVDVVAGYALPLPIAVICRMLGFPQADVGRLSAWSDALLQSVDPLLAINGTPPDGSGAGAAVVELHRYVEEIVRQRRDEQRRDEPGRDEPGGDGPGRDEPRGDLLTALLATAPGTDPGSAEAVAHHDEVVRTCVVLLVSGYETVVNLITNSVLTLMRNPHELDALQARPDRAERVVDEVLRIDPPVQLAVRTARDPLRIGGTDVAPGTTLVAFLGAANRDPAAFSEPDRFRPDRAERHTLSFGLGSHYCLGAALGLLQGRLAVARLAQRLHRPRLAAVALSYRRRVTIRGLDELLVLADAVEPRSMPWPTGPDTAEQASGCPF